MKISKLKEKLIFTAGYIILLLIFRAFNIPCLFKHFFGIPCPGCGMTRAVVSAARLDLLSAFEYHPMFWSMPFIVLYLFVDGRVFKNKLADSLILITIAVGFTLNWITNLV